MEDSAVKKHIRERSRLPSQKGAEEKLSRQLNRFGLSTVPSRKGVFDVIDDGRAKGTVQGVRITKDGNVDVDWVSTITSPPLEYGLNIDSFVEAAKEIADTFKAHAKIREMVRKVVKEELI